jgi:hypothetical protein
MWSPPPNPPLLNAAHYYAVMGATVRWSEALAWRMRRQFMAGTGAPTAEDIVGRLVAVPSWSGDADVVVGVRLADPQPRAVADAFSDGLLIKTFAFRGSMNYFTPQDAGIYLALRAGARQWERKSWREFYRLNPAAWLGFRETVRDALASGPLTQRELADVVVRDARFAHLHAALTDKSCTLLKPLAWQGDLSLALPRDGGLTLQSPTAVSGWSGIPELEDAGPQAIRAYLAAYGPASAEHLQYWLGEGLSAGRNRIAGWISRMLADEIVTVNVDGDELLVLAEDADELMSQRASPMVRLLPGLDPWILGPGTADQRVVPSDRRTEITRGANPVIVDGRVAGTWKIIKNVLTVSTHAGALSRDGLDAERARLAKVLGRELDLDGG